ncbi:MAG: ATP-grasp domain-containing protein [Gammaproteobacteria bacterium]|nr:MAG: ATP-grasp domain-containing protein [Gammaproteobacteria bacterium]
MASPRLLLISQPDSYRIAPYLNAARQMGFEVLVASRGEYSLVSEVHDGIHVDLDDHDAALDLILLEARKRPFSGVLGSDDSTVELAARVAEQLGLPHNSPEAARVSRRKDLARAHLSLAQCLVPIHCLVNLTEPLENQMAGLPFPCVVKPLNLSASRGVIRVNSEAEFIQACERIKSIIAKAGDAFESSHVLVEKYIDGFEVAYEGFLHNGELVTLALFDKPDPLTGPFFEETIYVTPSQLDNRIQLRIRDKVEQACHAYGLVTGPVHAELRINQENIWILEVASRTIGGDCARTLDTGTGLSLEALTIALAMGQEVRPAPPEEARGVMMIPIQKKGILKRVEGLSEARAVEYVEKVDIVIPEGHEMIPLPEGNQYPGYIFVRAETPEKVVNALRSAHEKLNFVVAPLWQPAIVS